MKYYELRYGKINGNRKKKAIMITIKLLVVYNIINIILGAWRLSDQLNNFCISYA